MRAPIIDNKLVEAKRKARRAQKIRQNFKYLKFART
jgi:hypothetical protein